MLHETSTLKLALPDGHLMNHVVPFLDKIGISFKGYGFDNLQRRPLFQPISAEARNLFSQPEQIYAKVIRPQDMPIHVANGNFDAALSGTDWLAEHKLRFPNSPVADSPLVKFDFSKVRIVAAAHKDFGDNLPGYIASLRSRQGSAVFRIASEYVYLADNFARQQQLCPYRIIMTYGATESLIPEDCDLIIENTETGNTLRKNNLEILDTLMESQGCLIVSRESMKNSRKQELLLKLKQLLEH